MKMFTRAALTMAVVSVPFGVAVADIAPDPQPWQQTGQQPGQDAPRFFIEEGGQQAGPFTMQQLQAKAAAGTLTQNTLAWESGMTQWTPAAGVPALAALFQSAQPAPMGPGPNPGPAPAPGQFGQMPAPQSPMPPGQFGQIPQTPQGPGQPMAPGQFGQTPGQPGQMTSSGMAQSFILGTWQTQTPLEDVPGAMQTATMIFGPNGTAQISMTTTAPGYAPQTQQAMVTYAVNDAGPQRFTLTVVPNGQAPINDTLVIVDDNTVRSELDGSLSKRTAR